jgi:hypothetical protein
MNSPAISPAPVRKTLGKVLQWEPPVELNK